MSVRFTRNAFRFPPKSMFNGGSQFEGREKIYGVAAAHAYFCRPAKNDKDPTAGNLPNAHYANGTYATLFSPYWQPRLTDLPAGVAAALTVMDK